MTGLNLYYSGAYDLWQVSDDWTALQELCQGELPDSDAKLLKMYLSGSVRAVVVEREYIDKDYRNVYSGFYSKKFSRLSSRATRLHLFDVMLTPQDILFGNDLLQRLHDLAVDQDQPTDLAGTTDGYVGYVVLRPTEYSRIGRTLLDPRKLNTHEGGQGIMATFRSNLKGAELKVRAFPHQSQDAEVHTCAHTAIWSLFRYLSQRYAHYPEMYPYDVAMLNTDLRYGRLVPGRGLYMEQVTAIFGTFGLGAEMYLKEDVADLFPRYPADSTNTWAYIQDAPDPRADEILRLLHCHIASGLPPVVGVPRHAVVAVGFQYGDVPRVARQGVVIPSTDYLKCILVNDDNTPPYLQVNATSPSKYNWGKIDSLVVPLPEKVFLTADKADIVITDLVDGLGPPTRPDGKPWAPNDDHRFIRHLVCTSSKNYKRWRSRHLDDYADVLSQPLPHFLWVAEFYPVCLWSAAQPVAVAEVVLDATAGRHDESPFLWIRYPERFAVNLARLYGDGNDVPMAAEWFDLPGDLLTFPGFRGNLVCDETDDDQSGS